MGSYGDINKVDTDGASDITAGKDGERLSYSGVRASHKMAEDDLVKMNNYQVIILNTGRNCHVDPAIIAGIISRESRAGKALKRGKGTEGDKEEDGWGDCRDEKRRLYNGFGLMQVDVNPKGGNHKKRGTWNSQTHLEQGTGILVDFIKKIEKKFPRWTKEQQLKGGLAAYNQGDGNVHSYSGVDDNTTGQDYSNDVVARAQCYKKYGY